MAADLLDASHGSSAHVRHGVLNAGHGNVTIGSIAYNNQNKQAEQRRWTLKESLDFPERAQRERTIRNTHRDTGRWFLQTQQYRNWQPSTAPGCMHDCRRNGDRLSNGRSSNDRPSNDRPSNDRPSNDRPSNDRPSNDEEDDDQEPARCCGIFTKAKKTQRSALGPKRTVRWDPNPGSSVQTDFPAPTLPLIPKKAARSDLKSGRITERTPSPEISVQTDWRQRLLWIKGNAGAGKSTLLKMVVDHDRETHTETLVLPHFFNARGSELEHSTKGMYRTLICWLLESQSKDFADRLDPTGTRATIQDWDIPELERLLNRALGIIDEPSVVFYIDALDECDEAQVREMLEYFRNLIKTACDAGRDVRVCFASRPYPHITFEDAVFLDLSQQQEHMRDIETYIYDRLKIEESMAAAELRRQVMKKAAGVFMWVVLVVQMLNEACDEGKVERLPQMLEKIPPGLHELFAYTLERYPKDRDATLVCFRLVLFSGTSMDHSQMWWAVQLGLGLGDEQIQRDYKRRSEAAMRRYIVGISKGLVEFKGTTDIDLIHAQFVHESVRDFLLSEGELQKLYGVRDRTDFTGQSHELLRDWFAAELVARRPQLTQAVDERGGDILIAEDLVKMGWRKAEREARADGQRISDDTPHIEANGPGRGHTPIANEEEERKTQFPLAQLASSAIWEQVEAAQQCGRDQRPYLDNVLERCGPYLLGNRQYQGGGHLVYCDIISPLLLINCPAVIRQTQVESAQLARRAGQSFGLIDSRSRRCPVADARRTGMKSVQALVHVYLQLEPWHAGLKELLQHLAQLAKPALGLMRRTGYNPLLDLAHVDPVLATFFVLVLASPRVLLHLDTLKTLVHSETDEVLLFVKVLLCFIQHDLHTDALDYSCKDTIKWALIQQQIYNSKKEDSEKEVEAGEEVRGAPSKLVALLRARYHAKPSSST